MPRPLVDLDSAPFWEGCAEHRFLVPACRACGARRWPPGPMCPVCRATDTDWIVASGTGRVYAWVVANHPVHPVLADQVPYIIALIDLPEGIRVAGNVVDCPPNGITAGMPVRTVFEVAPDGFVLPNFRPAGPDLTEEAPAG